MAKKKGTRKKYWDRFEFTNRFKHWYMGFTGFAKTFFRTVAAWQTIVILMTILVILYIMAAFYTGRGEFVIKLDPNMADEGFYLSETTDFSEKLITLRNDAVEHVTNITLSDIPPDVMDVDGKHNGKDYVAYTFYLLNDTSDTRDYQYELNVISTSKEVDTASWIMLFHNGKQQIYAQPNKEGYAECLYNRWEFPFMEYAFNPDYMQSVVEDAAQAHVTEEMIAYHDFDEIEGLYQLQTVPWEGEKKICSGLREDIESGEIDKYTVVIWLEGDDPDCTDELIGGHLEVAMRFHY